MSKYQFGKSSVSRDITICGFHVGLHVNENVRSYQRFCHSFAAMPSPGLIFGFCILPCGERFKNLVRMHRFICCFLTSYSLTTEGGEYREVYGGIWRYMEV